MSMLKIKSCDEDPIAEYDLDRLEWVKDPAAYYFLFVETEAGWKAFHGSFDPSTGELMQYAAVSYSGWFVWDFEYFSESASWASIQDAMRYFHQELIKPGGAH